MPRSLRSSLLLLSLLLVLPACDGRGRGNGGNRGGRGGGGAAAAVDPNSSCFGFSKGYGPCAGCAPGSPCVGGRTHKCHLCGGAHKAATCPKKKKG